MLRDSQNMEQHNGGGRGIERRSSTRRQHRRVYPGDLDDRRPAKRLFTPEIKKYLKGWLVRRRDNPYPNRDEKKTLAIQTGLTYVQVCNWFANWRRKLKNAGGEPQRSTWGHLIKVYNDQAQGNVEHFSICSDDSIWEREEAKNAAAVGDHCYTTITTPDINNGGSKYKNHIMKKYMRDLSTDVVPIEDDDTRTNVDDGPKILSKWLQSAANFRPRRENYVGWERRRARSTAHRKKHRMVHHGREELDAAEALTRLACTSASAS